jgi:hypothetical protein
MPRSGHTISHVYWGCGSLVHLVINIPIEYDEQAAQALRHRKVKDLAILSWDEFAARRLMALK